MVGDAPHEGNSNFFTTDLFIQTNKSVQRKLPFPKTGLVVDITKKK